MFYEAVKNDLANSKETSFNNTISSTISLITVLFEDLFEAINIKAVCVFLASGYKWVTVMHEIPISSAQSLTSFFHTLGLSSTTPLVPLVGAVSHEKVPTSP
jgi:hypothetical protein